MNDAHPPLISIQITNTLIERIRDGHYTPEDHFPSEAELCKEFKVSRGTVRTVLAALVAKDLLVKKIGIGSFVVPDAQIKLTGLPEIDLKVCMIMSGLMSDGGWNTQAYRGLDKLKSEGLHTTISEMVSPSNAVALGAEYAQAGYDLIIGHGWEFGDPFVELAPRYPEQKFFVTADRLAGNIPSNLQFFHPQTSYSGYMAGALAALVSKNHVVGFVGGGDTPIQKGISIAFQQAVEETVPGTKAITIITGDFNDVLKGRLAATKLIKEGADIIWHSADLTGLGVISGGIEGGARIIGSYSDQTSMAYSSFLSSISWDLDFVVYDRGQAVLNDTFEGGCNWEPPFSDVFYFSAGGKDTPFVNVNVPSKAQHQMEVILEGLRNGTIKVRGNESLGQTCK
jgi:basic membrane protein A and related proteins